MLLVEHFITHRQHQHQPGQRGAVPFKAQGALLPANILHVPTSSPPRERAATPRRVLTGGMFCSDKQRITIAWSADARTVRPIYA
jgi:hypothetical protein